jgi:cytochrome c biogenesis protein CcdA
MTVITETLSRANASFRRGGRITAAVLIVLGVALVMYWISRGFRGFALENVTHRPIGAWVTIVALLALLLWMFSEALRTSRTLLTPTGIEHGEQLVVQWSEVTVAEYARGWLRLTNREGRKFTLSLLYASASHPIIEAVQDHLPDGVRLRVH